MPKRPPNYMLPGNLPPALRQHISQSDQNTVFRYRAVADNTGSIASSGTSVLQTTFQYFSWLYKISAASTAGGTAAVGNRDAFTVSIQRQTGDTLVSEATIGTALFEDNTGYWFIGDAWPVPAGQTVQSNWTNLSTSVAQTDFIVYHVIEELKAD